MLKKSSLLAAAVVLALGAGVGFGVATVAADPTDSPEYKHMAGLVEEKNAGLDAAIEALEQAELDIAAIGEASAAELAALEGDLPTREADLEAALADLELREEQLEKARKETLALLRSVRAREKKVGIVEDHIAANTFGDGVYRVGPDIAPGTYRSINNVDCYWMISSDANGSNILQNNIVTGPALTSLSAGTFFTSSGCSKWTLQ